LTCVLDNLTIRSGTQGSSDAGQVMDIRKGDPSKRKSQVKRKAKAGGMPRSGGLSSDKRSGKHEKTILMP